MSSRVFADSALQSQAGRAGRDGAKRRAPRAQRQSWPLACRQWPVHRILKRASNRIDSEPAPAGRLLLTGGQCTWTEHGLAIARVRLPRPPLLCIQLAAQRSLQASCSLRGYLLLVYKTIIISQTGRSTNKNTRSTYE